MKELTANRQKYKINLMNRDIISIMDFTKQDILFLCEQAYAMREMERTGRRWEMHDKLKTRKLAYMFYEPSTRTKTSFITAMKELNGYVHGFSGVESTSVTKKETIRDTIKMIEANHFDVAVMRHPKDGSIQWAADVAGIPIINGGDGTNEHPTQSLLDCFTLYLLNNKRLDDISIGFGGDLAHGRTVRSLSLSLSHFSNITIRWAAEDALAMPEDLIDLLEERGVKVIRERTVKEVMSKVMAYYMTRPQLERMKNTTANQVNKMMKEYRIDLDKIKGMAAKLMHPLPVNSEIEEIEYGVYFSPHQAFFQQAENGIFMRKALLYEMLDHKGYLTFDDKLSHHLQHGNNRLRRIKKVGTRPTRIIADIDNGVVIDHIKGCKVDELVEVLKLEENGIDYIPAHLGGRAGKSILKLYLDELGERDLKKLALHCPNATINIIRNTQVKQKFVYLLCQNTNCVTRVVNEDVPPKFYKQNGTIRCRYCRHSYVVKHEKVTEEDKKAYVESLPAGI
ncbi:aspartate carbamoyltransferase [Candidatus Woesearchaeota archaeon]|nr:aspartate carbamoyltransferase [Candidatus Woesearchaeota archaeon]